MFLHVHFYQKQGKHIGGEMLRPARCAMSVHVQEPQVVEISGVLHSFRSPLIIIFGFGT